MKVKDKNLIVILVFAKRPNAEMQTHGNLVHERKWKKFKTKWKG